MITTHDLSLTWPDGSVVLDGLGLQVPTGASGLVGANGSGKSTLLRLLAGELSPTRGHVSGAASVGYLPQQLTLATDRAVDEHLGVAPVRRALRRLEAGSSDPADLEAVGEAWDVEERVTAALARTGLPVDVLDRRLGELSGGEATQVGLAAVLMSRPDVLLLDEPTNNLDAAARARLHDLVAGWRGTVLVVSHDPALLEHVDRIGDLRDGTVRWYGGGWSSYRAQVEAEQAAAQQAVTSAKADVRRQQHDLVESERVLAQRRKYAAKMYATKREPRAVMKLRKRAAQESASSYTRTHQERLASARDRLEEAETRVRTDQLIRVDLPGTVVPSGRVVATSEDLVLRTGLPVHLDLRGPERVAVVGPNGAGKTTLLHTLAGRLAPRAGTVTAHVPVGLLPQRLDLLDDAASVVANVARRAPGADHNTVRAQLARFLFRGRAADQLAGTLSGGERFRATLAVLLLADPAPQLLMLDEPTNNLDLGSREALVSALAAYGGALLVAGHDETFLEEIGVERRLDLSGPAAAGRT